MASIDKSFGVAPAGPLISAELLMTLARQMVSKAFIGQQAKPTNDEAELLSKTFQLSDTVRSLDYEQNWTFL